MSFRSTFLRVGLAGMALAAILDAAPADASQLVADGGFEAVNYGDKAGWPYLPGPIGDGWDVTGGLVNIMAGSRATNYLYYPQSGSQFAFLGHVNANGTLPNRISQDLATTPGEEYTLTFYAKEVANDNLRVTFGDQVLFDGAGWTRTSTDYELFTYVVTATSASTPLTFAGGNGWTGAGVRLDDVSVVPGAFPAPNPEPTPEPSSLLVAGLVAAWGWHRARSKAAQTRGE